MSHARLAPSKAAQWLNCAASVPLTDELPPGGSTSYADDGTASHILANWCFDKEQAAAKFIGHVIRVGDTDYIVDEERAAYVQDFVDKAYEIRGDDGVLFSEQRLPIAQWTGEKDAAGTSDVVILRGDELIVDDLKYGMGVRVDAEENEQLMTYALSALAQFDLAGDVKHVRLVIHQPRLGHISEWRCPVEHLLAFGERIKKQVVRIELATKTKAMWRNNPNDEYYAPGEKTCMWCPLKASCPALAKFVEKTVGASFEDLTHVQPAALVPNDDDAELGRRLLLVGVIEDWCRAIRAKVEAKLAGGGAIPGWKLVRGKRGNRYWADETEAEKALKAMRLSQDEMYKKELISPTTAEKLLKGQPKRWKTMQDLIKQDDGKLSVAPATDPRPAVSVAAVPEDFQNHDAVH